MCERPQSCQGSDRSEAAGDFGGETLCPLREIEDIDIDIVQPLPIWWAL